VHHHTLISMVVQPLSFAGSFGFVISKCLVRLLRFAESFDCVLYECLVRPLCFAESSGFFISNCLGNWELASTGDTTSTRRNSFSPSKEQKGTAPAEESGLLGRFSQESLINVGFGEYEGSFSVVRRNCRPQQMLYRIVSDRQIFLARHDA
jgi:hypothetical protein